MLKTAEHSGTRLEVEQADPFWPCDVFGRDFELFD